MEGLVYTLIGAAVFGLTALAYKKPADYARILPYVAGIMIATFVLCTVYGIGYQNGNNDTERHFNEHKDALFFDGSPFPFSVNTAFNQTLFLFIYLIVLAAIPHILGSKSISNIDRRKGDK